MSKAAFLQGGQPWDYTNSGTTAIEPNTIVAVGDRVGIVGGGGAGPLQPGALGIVYTKGVWLLPKAASTAIAQGDAVYYNADAGTVSKTAGAVIAGKCAWPAAADDELVRVDIGAPVAAAAAVAGGGGEDNG